MYASIRPYVAFLFGWFSPWLFVCWYCLFIDMRVVFVFVLCLLGVVFRASCLDVLFLCVVCVVLVVLCGLMYLCCACVLCLCSSSNACIVCCSCSA